MHYHYFTIEQREALERAMRARLADEPRMQSALARLHTAEFGVCAGCGQDIPYARLADDPAATLCRGCQEDRAL
jgi:RNA polymerase-binding transcription factor DksA